jgi:hypothetical protein
LLSSSSRTTLDVWSRLHRASSVVSFDRLNISIMVTGLEIAALILGVFPLIIVGLEHYEQGFQSMKEWVKFRGEFSVFMNALGRQKIFFRQNIEDLLSSVVESE